MEVDPNQPIPIYFQLKTLLVEEILKGRYGADGRIPTEHELCERFGISRTPVSRALSELADEGLILRHRRRGTFVNSHGLRRRPDQPEVRVVVSERLWGQVIQRRGSARDPGQRRHRRTAVAAPRPHPRGRRGTGPRPGDPGLGLDRRVRSVRLPLRPRGARRALGALRARGRLPRAARLVEPLRRAHVRGLGVRLGRGDLVPPPRAGRARTGATVHVGRASRRRLALSLPAASPRRSSCREARWAARRPPTA